MRTEVRGGAGAATGGPALGSKIPVPRRLRLIEHVTHPEPTNASRDLPFELVPEAVTEHGRADGCKDGELPLSDIGFLWKDECVHLGIAGIEIRQFDC